LQQGSNIPGASAASPKYVSDNRFVAETSAIARFAGRVFREGFRPRYEVRELLYQCYVIGYQSLPLVGITGFIMGLVLTLRLRPTMAQFGAESWIPTMVGMTIIQEMGPIITGLMVAGKVGSNIGAELSSMRVTEQIDAMEVSGTNPFKYLVATRVLAATLMVPVLALLSEALGLLAAYLGINLRGVTTVALFANNILGRLTFGAILPAVIKTFFFGFAIGLIGCYKGYYADKGTEGVGRAANSAVVLASLAVFLLDLLAVGITSLLGLN
jgi:phospholipid/cholesterol/gamma-HCH transport system permease protein